MYSTDNELISEAIAGNGAAWEEWIRRFWPALTRIAQCEFRLSAEDIEDLLQELVVALLADGGRRLKAYRGDAPLHCWLRSVWRHRCLDLKRRRSVANKYCHSRTVAGSDDWYRENVDLRILTGEVMQHVSDRERLLVDMYFLQGVPQRDIAEHLSISENTVASSLARARGRMRKVLKHPCKKKATPIQ
jgi:RNA polymerase sigma-70 factor (ECF subfamily)